MTDLAATAAALVYAAAIVLLLLVRTLRQYRATGSTGFNGFRGAAQDPAARAAGIGFAAAVLVGLVAPWLAAVGLLPVWKLPIALVAFATVVAGAGLHLGVTAQQAMGRSWRIGVDQAEATELVTTGPFRLVRNPIFTALMMIQAGTAVMAPTWLSLGRGRADGRRLPGPDPAGRGAVPAAPPRRRLPGLRGRQPAGSCPASGVSPGHAQAARRAVEERS